VIRPDPVETVASLSALVLDALPVSKRKKFPCRERRPDARRRRIHTIRTALGRTFAKQLNNSIVNERVCVAILIWGPRIHDGEDNTRMIFRPEKRRGFPASGCSLR